MLDKKRNRSKEKQKKKYKKINNVFELFVFCANDLIIYNKRYHARHQMKMNQSAMLLRI